MKKILLLCIILISLGLVSCEQNTSQTNITITTDLATTKETTTIDPYLFELETALLNYSQVTSFRVLYTLTYTDYFGESYYLVDEGYFKLRDGYYLLDGFYDNFTYYENGEYYKFKSLPGLSFPMVQDKEDYTRFNPDYFMKKPNFIYTDFICEENHFVYNGSNEEYFGYKIEIFDGQIYKIYIDNEEYDFNVVLTFSDFDNISIDGSENYLSVSEANYYVRRLEDYGYEYELKKNSAIFHGQLASVEYKTMVSYLPVFIYYEGGAEDRPDSSYDAFFYIDGHFISFNGHEYSSFDSLYDNETLLISREELDLILEFVELLYFEE